MEPVFVFSFAILCLVVSAYWFGRLTGPLNITLSIPGQIAVSISGSHAVAMDAQIHNGGIKLPEGALILSPISRPRNR